MVVNRNRFMNVRILLEKEDKKGKKKFQAIMTTPFLQTKKQSGHDFALLRLDYPIADNVYGIGAFANYRHVEAIFSEPK